MNEGIHLDLVDTWIVPGQIRKAKLAMPLAKTLVVTAHYPYFLASHAQVLLVTCCTCSTLMSTVVP